MKKIISGFTPTNLITIGNYLGVIKPLLEYKNTHEIYLFCANLHSITMGAGINQKIYSKNTLVNLSYKMIASFLALGFNGKNTYIFIQSMIPEHFQLAYILNCSSTIGTLFRMNQFKTKKLKLQSNSISSGLLYYPCLMAADILLYKSNLVYVGSDQLQHVEFTRNLVNFWNSKYNNSTFIIPEVLKNKYSFKIKSLSDPKIKMSKSDGGLGTIYLQDEESIIRKKISRAVTDSENRIWFNAKTKPGISNLMIIYQGFTGKTLNWIEKEYKNKSYVDFKNDLSEIIIDFCKKFQFNFKKMFNIEKIELLLKKKLIYLKKKAKKIINQTYKDIGLI